MGLTINLLGAQEKGHVWVYVKKGKSTSGTGLEDLKNEYKSEAKGAKIALQMGWTVRADSRK